jgi:hypothetical protein
MPHREDVEDALAELRGQRTVRFANLVVICTKLFGPPRQRRSSHLFFRVPWAGKPLVNLQRDGKDAKAYQVEQVRKALERLLEDL